MASRGSRRTRFWVATVAVATALVLLLIPVGVLTITHEDTGRLLWRVVVGNGSQVELHYTNSLLNAPTTERFIVTEGLLRLVEINSTSQAVLEYLVLEPPYERRGDRVISKRRGPSFAELTIRIGQTGQQRFVIDNREIPLFRIGTGEAVRVRMLRMSRVQALLLRPAPL